MLNLVQYLEILKQVQGDTLCQFRMTLCVNFTKSVDYVFITIQININNGKEIMLSSKLCNTNHCTKSQINHIVNDILNKLILSKVG